MEVSNDKMSETASCSKISVGVPFHSSDSPSNFNLNQVDGYRVHDETILNPRSSVESDLSFPSRTPSLLDELRTGLENRPFMKKKDKRYRNVSLDFSLSSSTGSHNSTLNTDAKSEASETKKLNLFSHLRKKDLNIDFTLGNESSPSIENEPPNDLSINLSKIASSKLMFKRPQSKRVSVKFDCDVSDDSKASIENEQTDDLSMNLSKISSSKAIFKRPRAKRFSVKFDCEASDDSKDSLDQESILNVSPQLPKTRNVGLRSTRLIGLRKRKESYENIADFTLSNSQHCDTSMASNLSNVQFSPVAVPVEGELDGIASTSPDTIKLKNNELELQPPDSSEQNQLDTRSDNFNTQKVTSIVDCNKDVTVVSIAVDAALVPSAVVGAVTGECVSKQRHINNSSKLESVTRNSVNTLKVASTESGVLPVPITDGHSAVHTSRSSFENTENQGSHSLMEPCADSPIVLDEPAIPSSQVKVTDQCTVEPNVQASKPEHANKSSAVSLIDADRCSTLKGDAPLSPVLQPTTTSRVNTEVDGRERNTEVDTAVLPPSAFLDAVVDKNICIPACPATNSPLTPSLSLFDVKSEERGTQKVSIVDCNKDVTVESIAVDAPLLPSAVVDAVNGECVSKQGHINNSSKHENVARNSVNTLKVTSVESGVLPVPITDCHSTVHTGTNVCNLADATTHVPLSPNLAHISADANCEVKSGPLAPHSGLSFGEPINENPVIDAPLPPPIIVDTANRQTPTGKLPTRKSVSFKPTHQNVYHSPSESCAESDLSFPSRTPSLLDELRTGLENRPFMKKKDKRYRNVSLDFPLSSSTGSHNSTLNTDAKSEASETKKLNLFSHLRKKDLNIDFTLGNESSPSIENEPPNDLSINLSKIASSKLIFKRPQSKRVSVKFDCDVSDDSKASIENEQTDDLTMNLSKISSSKTILKRPQARRFSVKFDCEASDDSKDSLDQESKLNVSPQLPKSSNVGLRSTRLIGLRNRKESYENIADFTLSNSQHCDTSMASNLSNVQFSPVAVPVEGKLDGIASTSPDTIKLKNIELELQPPDSSEQNQFDTRSDNFNTQKVTSIVDCNKDVTVVSIAVDAALVPSAVVGAVTGECVSKQRHINNSSKLESVARNSVNTLKVASTESGVLPVPITDGHSAVHTGRSSFEYTENQGSHSLMEPCADSPIVLDEPAIPSSQVKVADQCTVEPNVQASKPEHANKSSAVSLIDADRCSSLKGDAPLSPVVQPTTTSRVNTEVDGRERNTEVDTAVLPPSAILDAVVDKNICIPACPATNSPLTPSLSLFDVKSEERGTQKVSIVDCNKDVTVESIAVDAPLLPSAVVDAVTGECVSKQGHINNSSKHENVARNSVNTLKVTSVESGVLPVPITDCHSTVHTGTNVCNLADATTLVPLSPNLAHISADANCEVKSGPLAPCSGLSFGEPINENPAIDAPLPPPIIVDTANRQTPTGKLPTRKSVSFKPTHQNVYHSPPEYHNDEAKHSSLPFGSWKDSGGYDEFSKIQMTSELSEIQTSVRVTRSKKRYSSTPLPKPKKTCANPALKGKDLHQAVRREAKDDNVISANPFTRTAPTGNEFLVPPPPLFATKPVTASGELSPLEPVCTAAPSPKEGEELQAKSRDSSSSDKTSVDLSYEHSLNISAIPRDLAAPQWGNVFHSTPLRRSEPSKKKLKKKVSSTVPHQENLLVDRSVNTMHNLRSRSRQESVQLKSGRSSSKSNHEDESSQPSVSRSTVSTSEKKPKSQESSPVSLEPASDTSSIDNSSPGRISIKDNTVLSSQAYSHSRARDFHSSKSSRSSYLTRGSLSSYDSHRKMPSRRLFTPLDVVDKENEDNDDQKVHGTSAGSNDVLCTANRSPVEAPLPSHTDLLNDGNSDSDASSSRLPSFSRDDSISSSSDEMVAPNIIPHESLKSQIDTLGRTSRASSVSSEVSVVSPPRHLQQKTVNPSRPRSKFSSRSRGWKSEDNLIFPKAPKRRRPAIKFSKNDECTDWFKRPRKLFKPGKWASKKLYDWLDNKLRPDYGLKTTLMSEKVVIDLQHAFLMVSNGHLDGALDAVRRHTLELKLCTTELEFWSVIHKWMPFDFRMKVMPLGGAFGSSVKPRTLPDDPL